jgi:MtN3 and saliva related transmembrane protein
MTTYLGYLAGFITVGAFLPQALRILRTRQTRDLSLGTFALLVTSGSLWIVYGVLNRDWPVIAANVGMVALNGIIAGAKIRYERNPNAGGKRAS